VVYANKIPWKIIGITAVILILIFLYFVNPDQALFAPKCLFHMLTGLECPACGSQRAVHQFLHFHFIEGIRLNPFIFISVPYGIALVWTEWFDPKNKFPRLKAFCRNRKTVYTYMFLFVAWWILRNII